MLIHLTSYQVTTNKERQIEGLKGKWSEDLEGKNREMEEIIENKERQIEGLKGKWSEDLMRSKERLEESQAREKMIKEEVRRHVMVYAAFANPSNPDPPPSFPLRSTK